MLHAPACEGIIISKSPEEWVDASIECGSDPYICQERDAEGAIAWYTCTRTYDVDWSKYPAPFPDEWFDQVFTVLDRMGRVRRLEDARSEGAAA
jgi:hypothetical protein